MQVQIRFTASGSSSVTGNFAPGDTLRCSADHARHLVDECRCAVYVDAQQATPAEQPAEATSAPAKRARRRHTGA